MGDNKRELVIIGGGPAGLQAALSAASEGIDTLVIEAHTIGGQIRHTPRVENFAGAGVYGTSGAMLTESIRLQAELFGARFLVGKVIGLQSIDNHLMVRMADTAIEARAVIIASGMRFRKLEIEGEDEASPNKLFYGPMNSWSNNPTDDVAIVGGGNSAAQAILHVAERTSSIVHVFARSGIKASHFLQQRMKLRSNIAIHNETPSAIFASGGECRLRCSTGDIDVCATYVCAGMLPNTEFLKGALTLASDGRIVTDDRFMASIPNVFAIGDVRAKAVQRVTSAIGSGSDVQPHLWAALRKAMP